MQKVSKKSVDYRDGTEDKHCSNCIMFHPISKACDLVAGVIFPRGVCDRWETKKDVQSPKN